MPLEMRLDDAQAVAGTPTPAAAPTPVGPPTPAPAPTPAAAGPAALRDLIAAGLVTHEAIGDPARLGPEAASLRALCALVAGPVYRLEPFHYAFAARPGDLDGALAGRDADAQAAGLGAALAAVLGPDAVWIGATDLLPAPEAAGDPAAADAPLPEAALPEAALIVLRAHGAAVTEGLAAADPDLRAVIDARLAAETARRAAEFAAALGLGTAAAAEGAAHDRRLGAIEARLEALLEAQDAAGPALAARLGAIEAAAARARDAEVRAARDFEARLGLALAEFLARLERRDAAAVPLP